jgi:hypothetical protein
VGGEGRGGGGGGNARHVVGGRGDCASRENVSNFRSPVFPRSDQYKTSYSAVAYISTAVLVIVLCILVAVRKSINTAIDVIRIGTDALKALPSLLFFPCTNVLCLGLFLVWWLFVAACLQSAGQVTSANLGDDLQGGLDALKAQYGVSVNTTALLGLVGNMNTTTLS